jgi:hypothetical protein
VFPDTLLASSYCTDDLSICFGDADCDTGTCEKAVFFWGNVSTNWLAIGGFVGSADIGVYDANLFFDVVSDSDGFLENAVPAPDTAYWYLMRPECSAGSWQTSVGAEPARDTALP